MGRASVDAVESDLSERLYRYILADTTRRRLVQRRGARPLALVPAKEQAPPEDVEEKRYGRLIDHADINRIASDP
jgi:hypothetical protein